MTNLCRLLAFTLALVSFASAQTTVTNQGGKCSTGIFCSLPILGSPGTVTFAAIVGPNCLLGQSCSFPSGYAGTSFAFQWPDGSSATAEKFSGAMAYTGNASCGTNCSAYFYTISGTFSGQDSKGRTFTGSTHQAITISHPSRGGNSAADTGGSTTVTFASATQPSPSPDFSLTANPATLTLQTGQSAIIPFTLAPAGGFAGTESFNCSGLPASTSCSFDPPTLVADGSNTPLTTKMTITVTAASGQVMRRPGRHETPLRHIGAVYQVLALILPFALLSYKNRKGRKGASLLIAVLLIAGIGTVSCGGTNSSSASSSQTPISSLTQADASTIVVTAANASGRSHSVSIDLTLMP